MVERRDISNLPFFISFKFNFFGSSPDEKIIMSKLVLQIPERTYDNFGHPIQFFFKFLNDVSTTDFEELVIDFSATKFCGTFLLAGLSSIANQMKNRRVKVRIIHNNFTKSYLETIKFPFGTDDSKIITQFQSKTYIPIISFPNSEKREQILTTVNALLKNQLKLKLNILSGIYYLIDELTNNIADHSKSKKGYMFAQFFPQKNYLNICIYDNGIGIYKSYMNSAKFNPSSNSEAINFAIYGKSTKDLPESRGFGISTSREMLTKGLNGSFFLFSENSFFIQNREREEIIANKNITENNGCFLALRIPALVNDNFSYEKYIE